MQTEQRTTEAPAMETGTPPATEIVLDSGGWVSGPALDAPHRRLARDIRSDIIGEVMAEPGSERRNFWLRRPGGGTEWEVPRRYMQWLDDAEAAA